MVHSLDRPDFEMMSDDADLQAPEQWDFAHPKRRRPVKKTRAIVSVAFSHEEFETVCQLAEARGMYTSELIRKAALGLVGGTLCNLTTSSNLTYFSLRRTS